MVNGFQNTKEITKKIAQSIKDYAALIGKKDENNTSFGGVVPGLGMLSDEDNFNKSAEDISQGIFKLIAMGEFKNGKSSLLNSMIGGDILPTRIVACTAIITILVFGKKTNQASVYYIDKEEPEVISLEEFNSRFRLTNEDRMTIEKEGKLDRFSNVHYALIECDYPLCENGVRLIDSPGLGEAISRSKTTLEFLPKANAILFLLKSDKLFTMDESNYILSNFVNKQLKNLFFVVNLFNVKSSQDLEDIRETVEDTLKSVFNREDGSFDEELYRRRVFFIDAYKALESKKNKDDAGLIASGLPPFEKELENFLVSDDRTIATFQSTLTTMANVFVRAQEQIENDKNALKAPLEILEKGRIESEKILKELDGEIRGIEKTFEATQKILTAKVYQNLNEYINEMENMWEADSKVLETKIGLKEMFKLAGSAVFNMFNEEKKRARQEEIIRPISDEVGAYIERKLSEWADQLGTLIEPELKNLRQELHERIEEIDIRLDNAVKVFSNGLDSAGALPGNDTNGLQLIISLIQGDVSILVENAAGGGLSWGEFFKKYLIQAVMQIITFSVIGGPLGLLAFIVLEIFQMIKGAGDLNDRVLAGLKTKLFSQLRDSFTRSRSDFEARINQEMGKQCAKVTQGIRNQIQETKKRQDDLLREKRNRQFDASHEMERLDAILGKMFQLTDDVYQQVYGKHISRDDIHKLATQVRLSITED